ncbi:MAG: N-acetylmuramoyl-L-alanine amidase [Deltaproteobacteria bacterium]|nr:N-acetylmuramoyl-L-alanine amidase [Deltaproteobacteria bacterium]
MIDPGHGGTNSGARSTSGVYEKRLTLAVSREVAVRLRKAGLRVLLTRHQDRYLTLAQRVQRANRAKAALFVSVHFNASESRSQRGFETYVLSRKAIDKEAKRLAMGAAQAGRNDDMAAILTDLRQRALAQRAGRFASMIQRGLRKVRGKALDRGLRQAPFDVLLGLQMPGVLVELGFIDHPVEGLQMLRRSVQQDLAKALAVAIKRFLRTAD